MVSLKSLRRPTINQVRLTTGLILAVYVTGHLLNHSVGLISLQAADNARAIFHTFWHTPIGTPLLYGALIIHVGLGLRALLVRRSLRMPMNEAIQLVFGLLVPSILLAHILHTRVTGLLTGVDIGYPFIVAGQWFSDPTSALRQAALLVLVWTHLCIGLNFSLTLRSWYPRFAPLLLAFAVAMPIVALLGYLNMGQEVAARVAADPLWLPGEEAKRAIAHPVWAWIVDQSFWLAPAFMGGLVTGALLARAIRHVIVVGRGRVDVHYSDGRTVKVDRGASILEASRMNDIPHASFCGGRGRCTTCRVRVDAGAEELPPPNAIEAAALNQLGSPPGVRLACQCRPTAPVSVAPLIPASRQNAVGRGVGGVHGEERPVVVLFIDLRGSTALAENRLPFDVVFILNEFFSAMTASVERHGGHYSNFTGDGLMALYGLEDGVEEGARGALRSAFAMLRALKALNERLKGELEAPLEMGIGIHVGSAIVGEMGPPKHPVLTALGDPVNTTARLESLTKENGVPIIISEDAARAGDIDLAGLAIRETVVKGRVEPVRFFALPCPPDSL